jgi:hypothetical protein
LNEKEKVAFARGGEDLPNPADAGYASRGKGLYKESFPETSPIPSGIFLEKQMKNSPSHQRFAVL